jgi:hypothetical protein
MLGDLITYTYNIVNNGMVDIEDLSLSDNKLGNIPLTTTNILPGDNITATATYTVVFSDLLVGSIKNIGIVTGEDLNGKLVIANSNEVVISTNIIKALLTKAEILKLSGVPGKGIDTAPGLQKPFNPNSKASDNAGKKEGKGTESNQAQVMDGNIEQNNEQNQEQEMNIDNGSQNREKEKNNNKEKNNGKGKGKNK